VAVSETKQLELTVSQQLDEPEAAAAQLFWQSLSTWHAATHVLPSPEPVSTGVLVSGVPVSGTGW
jgi:hypothetical protein